MKSEKKVIPRGRPRAFDADKALDCALEVFWKKGYEGASLPDLTKAMGINRPSLYAAFGNKESLFRKVVQRYVQGPGAHVAEAIREPTARAVAERLLHGTINLLTDPKHPRGCLIVQGALACGEAAESVQKELIALRAEGQTLIRKRFERAIAEGDLPKDADAADLARFLATIVHGMAVQSTSGANRSELRRVAETAMRAWPEKKAGRPRTVKNPSRRRNAIALLHNNQEPT